MSRVLTTPKCAAPAHLNSKIDRARKQFATLRENDRENAIRGVFLGGLFWQIKEAAGHGNFERLASERMPEIPKRTRAEFMRLWREFVSASKLELSAEASIPNAQHTLALSAKGAEAEITAAAIKFVGDLSLHALMTEYGVRDKKSLGGARTKGDAASSALNPEQLYLFARDEIGGVIDRAETLLVKENRLQHLVAHPEELRGVVESLRTLADKVEAAAKPLLKKS